MYTLYVAYSPSLGLIIFTLSLLIFYFYKSILAETPLKTSRPSLKTS